MKFLLISPKNRTVYNFRGDLIKEIINKGYEVLVTGPDQTDVDKITALGARFVEVPMNKTGTNPLKDLKYCRNLTQLIRRERPDAVLGYTSKPVIYGTIAAKLAGVKNINAMITGAGYTFTAKTAKAKVLGAVVKSLYKLSLAQADHVIFQNRDDMNEFAGIRLVKRDKCNVVNGSGVNMEQFKPSEQVTAKAERNGITFLMLSRTLKSKGVREYLSAARKVKEKYPDTRFILLGKYEYDMQDAVPPEEIEQYISDGIIERLEETDNTSAVYELCDVYVLPSYREGTPRTVLEAMSMCKPIITTDTNGCRETVIDGKTGFLVPIKDAEAVSDKMLYFIEHPEMIKTMGKASRDYCEEKFEISKVNKAMLKYMNIE